MIIDYDRNPSLTEDQKLQSLVENLMLAFGETMDLLNKQQKQMDATDKKIDKLLEAIGEIQSDIEALEAVAADAILQSTAS